MRLNDDVPLFYCTGDKQNILDLCTWATERCPQYEFRVSDARLSFVMLEMRRTDNDRDGWLYWGKLDPQSWLAIAKNYGHLMLWPVPPGLISDV